MSNIYESFSRSNLPKRVASLAIMLPFALFIFISGGFIFTAAILAVAVLMAFEWQNMVDDRSPSWQLFGVAYILIPVISVLYIREMDHGLALTLYLFFVVWITDTAAYLFGILLGGPKLAPSISPSKSWTGACGGLLAAILVATTFVILGVLPSWNFVYGGVLISIAGQLGDLLESYLKRRFAIKDSGSIIPGHGGVMDRMDSIVISAPLLAIMLIVGVL